MTAESAQRRARDEELWERATRGQLATDLLTTDRPFCAGVLLVRDGGILVSLSVPDVAARDADGTDWFIGGVGGGQEPGEDLWECARREAREELGLEPELVAAPLTYLHDIDHDQLWSTRAEDTPAPFVLQRLANSDPTKPFKPGLPVGPYIYLGLFLAQVADPTAAFMPNDDDIAALAWIPLRHWAELDNTPQWQRLVAMGAKIAAGGHINADARIHLSKSESLAVTAPLLARHPEILVTS
jgi:8-oxo-dGTP pyrophosphatase MutT (NUDIX family)